jgi:translation initiation factor 1
MSKKNIKSEGGFVFSTNPNFNIENENEAAETLPPNEQKLKVWLEKNHRGGKTASVIKDFVGNEEDLEQLAKVLKNKCGTGGSAKDGEIIIQGDHREKIIKLLQDMGYAAKKAGG